MVDGAPALPIECLPQVLDAIKECFPESSSVSLSIRNDGGGNWISVFVLVPGSVADVRMWYKAFVRRFVDFVPTGTFDRICVSYAIGTPATHGLRVDAPLSDMLDVQKLPQRAWKAASDG